MAGIDPLKQWMTIPCEDCGDENPQLIGNVVNRDELTCRHCGGAIDLADEAWNTKLRETIECFRNNFYRPK